MEEQNYFRRTKNFWKNKKRREEKMKNILRQECVNVLFPPETWREMQKVAIKSGKSTTEWLKDSIHSCIQAEYDKEYDRIKNLNLLLLPLNA